MGAVGGLKTNARLLSSGPFGTNFSGILIKIQNGETSLRSCEHMGQWDWDITRLYSDQSITNVWYEPIGSHDYDIPHSLQWRHNEHGGVSNNRRLECLLHRLFRPRSKKTSKLRVTGLCEGNSPVAGEFSAQRASNAENVSMWQSYSPQVGTVYQSICIHQDILTLLHQCRSLCNSSDHRNRWTDQIFHKQRKR